MALSNWAILGLNENGVTEGELQNKQLGYTVEIYKSWVYIRDPQAYREESGYKNDIVMKIDETSELKYQNMYIDVWKPVSNEVYVAARTGYYHDDDSDVNILLGCGVYGYEGEEWSGVTDEHMKKLLKHLSETTVIRNHSISIPDDPDEYNFGDLAILERTGSDPEINELYQSDEDPIFQQIIDQEWKE